MDLCLPRGKDLSRLDSATVTSPQRLGSGAAQGTWVSSPRLGPGLALEMLGTAQLVQRVET